MEEMEEQAYIDSNVFLDSILNRGKEGIKATELLEAVKKGKMKMATSTLTFDEVFWIVKKERGYENALLGIEFFLSIPNLRFIDVSLGVLFTALEIMKENRLDPRDAIHASCALSSGIRLIISEDSDFDKVKGLKRKGIADLHI
ncbi:MAG: type II toxin-antitoxin system VapC family toxin [Candidatus Aenigmarchaeota archaeon]|nr:type II toxin-antitoxin system VapC family toxin [Candidatus Aenigmarchaeota archaeon]